MANHKIKLKVNNIDDMIGTPDKSSPKVDKNSEATLNLLINNYIFFL